MRRSPQRGQLVAELESQKAVRQEVLVEVLKMELQRPAEELYLQQEGNLLVEYPLHLRAPDPGIFLQELEDQGQQQEVQLQLR
jgi:hypothetical protein